MCKNPAERLKLDSRGGNAVSRTRSAAITVVTIGLMFGLAVPDRSAPEGWRVYRSNEHLFQISYPPGFCIAEIPSALVENDAVVTFVPESDSSISKMRASTNLISVSVTIAVSDLTGIPKQESEPCALDGLPRRFRDLDKRWVDFTRSYLCEGAVGNRYETSTMATSVGGRHYEIILFVHSANPSCYPAGTIAIFNRTEIARLFEAMVNTFLPVVERARSPGLAGGVAAETEEALVC